MFKKTVPIALYNNLKNYIDLHKSIIFIIIIENKFFQVLSGKIMPISAEGNVQGNTQFCEAFLIAGGLTLITSLLQRDSLPPDVHYEIRQNIYLIVLQLLRYIIYLFSIS